MPEAATLAPPPAKTPVPSQPQSPAPAAAAPPAKPTPMQRAQASLENFIDGKKPEPKTPPPKSDEPQNIKEPAQDTPPPEPDKGTTPTEPADKTAVEPGGKQNPWKLVESYKTKAAKLEKEIADFRSKSNLPELETKWKSAEERAIAAEKRAKELADEIRFVNYQKSDEFVKNHQQPWERACQKAAKDLSGLALEDSSGNRRKATINDLMTLCSMELGQAREQADAWFGSSADDVMDHRRKLNELMESQQLAIEEAKTNGEQRSKQQMEGWNKLRDETAGMWQKFNNEAVQKYDFLKLKEGDEEHNNRLTKAQSTVESAFSGNALDPRLSPEDRAKIVQAQVAVRNRAIGYSVLKLENDRLKAKLTEAEKSLKEFQESEPTAGRGKTTGKAAAQPANPMDAARARMEAHYVT